MARGEQQLRPRRDKRYNGGFATLRPRPPEKSRCHVRRANLAP